ncbi:PHP domain-containing protein [Haloplasma contractile]|uniref:PHP domain protein n=1 Tax=Haloplasma contractile SSD-17B TaxID=1033810 RepID=U2EFH0_9MOLU|nr:PHP domain-containing protein [Haloplasma contractile]ERJ13411.1 PHP domain protein [Haloplasma contractile SSD-17B]
MKIDLHLHCKERSGCSIATEIEQIEAAIGYGLDGIVITDHDKLVPKEHLKELNDKYAPFKVFGGVEVTTVPNGDHVLVIGVTDDALETEEWTYERLYKFVKTHNGFIALCHPYRYGNTVNIDIATFVPDAIEIHSTNIGVDDTPRIETLAKRLGCKLIANSDSHHTKDTGIYHNIIPGYPDHLDELTRILLEANIEIGRDEKRVTYFNKKVRERELVIKKMIEEGKTAEDYTRITGEWDGNFNRVLLGKTYEI